MADEEQTTPSRDAIFGAVATSITAFGVLAIGILALAGIAFFALSAVLCAAVSAAASYVAMYANMVALTNPMSLGAYRIAILVNPMMTLVAAAFWLLGMFQLWG